MISTSSKIAFGFILLISLLLGAIGYIYQEMNLLTEPSELEANINKRRKITNQIISQLYDVEIIGQTSAPGKSMSSSRICWPCGKLKKASIHYRLI